MATTSERIENNATTNISDDDKKKKEEDDESKKLSAASSTQSEQGSKTTEKVDDLNQIGKTDTLSSIQSTNGDKKSDQTPSISDTNSEKTVETTITITQQKEESGSTPVSSLSSTDDTIKTEETTVTSSNSNSNENTKKDELTKVPSARTNQNQDLTSQLAASSSNQDKKKDTNNAFPIEKDDEQHLTEFQRQKAKYFFNVNLDIENKEYVTWEDVEFYLLFHITTSGKDVSDGGNLEAQLSRAARAFWEHVHDQIPLPDGKRDKLTLNQFLDTWASLIDYVVETNRLPPIIQDLIKLGFELYSTDNGEGQTKTIQPQAFDQLFQKMNLGRPFAIMAYKYLTDNGTKPLDADKIDSIVKAVITSSDDEHDSHFLLPGFFKTIADNKNNEKDNKNKSTSSVQDKEQTEVSGKPTPTPKPPSPPPSTPSSQSQQPKTPSAPPTQEQQKPNEPQNVPPSPASPASPEKKSDNVPVTQKQTSSTTQNGVINSPTSAPSANQQQNIPPPPPPPLKPQKAVIQQEDEGIRHLLRYYHIDDGDIVEVAGGSVQRLVLVHPERPLPPYIQQNQQLLQKLQSDPTNVSSVQQNGFNTSNTNEKSPQGTKPPITLEERVSRGEAQKGPTVPLRQEQKQENSSSTGVRQVYPQLSAAQQEEQQRQAKLQATQPIHDQKPTTEQTSTANDVTLSSKQNETKQTKDFSRDDEEKIIAAVLKQLAPIVEKRVAAELRRIQSGDTDQDEDDDDVIQFPFMLGGGFPFFAAPRGGPPPSQGSGEQQQQNVPGQGPQQAAFGGFPGGAGLFPPQLIMAMMNDLARGGMGGEMPGFSPNTPPPSRGPAGVEGFMMFADDDQLMGSPLGYPPHSGPRF